MYFERMNIIGLSPRDNDSGLSIMFVCLLAMKQELENFIEDLEYNLNFDTIVDSYNLGYY